MSLRLRDQIVERIRARGPLTFAAYMEVALYDPEDGFFSSAPVGREFVTSAHVSPVFGALIARQLSHLWEALGRPEPFTVVDLGAGDGTLGRQILTAGLPSLRYVCLERSAAARARLAQLGIEVWEQLEPFEGCLIANELLDNVPFHILRARAGRTLEVMVGVDDAGDLVPVEQEPTLEVVRPLADGEERPVSPSAAQIARDLASALQRGYAFFVDYGFVAGEIPEPIRTYRAHRMGDDPFVDPGSADITGPVDFDAFARAARAAGLQTWGPVTQRESLMRLGYREVLDEMRARQHEHEGAGEWRTAIETYGARGDASMLVDPHGLGGLRVLALGTEGLPPPRAV